MSTIKVMTFPYGSDEPIVQEIENAPDEFIQIIEGKFQDVPLPMNYLLLMNDSVAEDFKFQEKYNLHGNFIICKHNYRRPMSLENKDIEYLKEKASELIDGRYPEVFMPDIEAYVKHMRIEPQTSEFPILDELEELVEAASFEDAEEILKSIEDIAYYTRARHYKKDELGNEELDSLHQQAITGLNTINRMAEKHKMRTTFPGDFTATFIMDEHIVNLAKEYYTRKAKQ